jgi:hypothetical protein
VDKAHTQAEAADTLLALAEAHIGTALLEAHTVPALPLADKLLWLTAAHTVPALVPAAGRLAGLGPL